MGHPADGAVRASATAALRERIRRALGLAAYPPDAEERLVAALEAERARLAKVAEYGAEMYSHDAAAGTADPADVAINEALTGLADILESPDPASLEVGSVIASLGERPTRPPNAPENLT